MKKNMQHHQLPEKFKSRHDETPLHFHQEAGSQSQEASGSEDVQKPEILTPLIKNV